MHTLGPEDGTLTVHTGKGGAAAKAGHDLAIEVTRWSGDARRRRAIDADRRRRARCACVERQRRHDAARRRGEGGHRADDRRGGAQGRHDRVPLERASTAARRRPRRRGRARPARRHARRSRSRSTVDGGHLTGSATVKQTDWQHEAVLGAVRDPEGRRRRRGRDRRRPSRRSPTMVELDHTFADRQAHRLQLGRDPRPRPRSSRASRAARCSSARAPSRPRPRSRSRWARCR